MSSLLWGSPQVKERLIGYSEYEFLIRLENTHIPYEQGEQRK